MSNTVTWILVLNILTGYCDSKKTSVQLNGRVNILERRLDQEISARSHDVATIFTKIEEIDQKINETLDASSFQDGDDEMCLDDNKQSQTFPVSDIKELKNSITNLYRAFEEEKQVNVEMRSVLPEMKTQLEVCNSRMVTIQSENELLKTKHVVLKQENQMLKEILENVTENMENRLTEVHGKYEKLVLNITFLQKEIMQDTSSKDKEKSYSSCKDALNNGRTASGIYKIRRKQRGQTIQVYCDQKTNNGGWIVFQRREDGSEDFNRGWSKYKKGFGNLEREFWIGNNFIHEITTNKEHELHIDMEDFNGLTLYAEYSTFKIHSEGEKYRLEVDGYRGNATDGLELSNGNQFSTKDRKHTSELCRNKSWWLTTRNPLLGCYELSNLNGVYGDSVWWGFLWHLKFTEMKIRSKEKETTF